MINFLKKYQKVQWMIFSIALLIYINSIPNKWAIDDGVIIYQNNFVKKGISGIPDILSKDAFAGFYGKDINGVVGGRYRPLTPCLFALQAEVFASTKIDQNQAEVKDKEGHVIKDLSDTTWFPNSLHFFNALWYALLCLLIYRTLLLLFNSKQETNTTKADFLAFTTTLIYTVHPLHTEAVANVKGLDEILTMLGSIATLYFILKHNILHRNENGLSHKKYLIMALVSYTLALFAKENAVTFIAIIPLALWFFTDASTKTIFKLVVPLLLPLLFFLGVRSAVLHQPNKAEVAEELMNDPFLVLDPNAQYAPLIEGSDIKMLVNPNENTFTKMPYSNQLATNFYTWSKYLQLLVAPYPLTVDYYPRHIQIKSFKDVGVIFSVILHLFLLAWAFYNIRKKKILAFGILYYFITFSIVSNLFFSIGTNMAERFMFMPSLGFCLIVANLLYELGKKWSDKQTNNGFTKIYLGLGAFTIVFSWMTFQRNFDWKNNYTLFSKDILVSENSGKINTDLASEIINQAFPISSILKDENTLNEEDGVELQLTDDERKELLLNAIQHLKKSLEIHPMSNLAWFKMANAHHFLGEMESNNPKENVNNLNIALAAYEVAEKYKGKDTTIANFKSICNMDIGKLQGQKLGEITKCIQFLEKATGLNPKNAEAYLLLGTAYSMKKDYEKSIFYTQKSLALRPKDRDTKKNLATAYQQQAYAVPSKKQNLLLAEKLLLEVLKEEESLPDNDELKKDGMIRTLDLLIRNYSIQGNSQKVTNYQIELEKVR